MYHRLMKFGMNTLANSVVVLALCAVVVPSVRAAEPATRYVVIFEKNYAFEEKYSVMSMDEYREAAKLARGEVALMRKALTLARREWKDAEEQRLGIDKNNNQRNTTSGKVERPKSFPSLKLNRSPGIRFLGFCDSQAAAESKCSAFEARAAQRLTPKVGSRMSSAQPSRMSSSPPSRLKRSTSTRSSSSSSSSDRKAAREADVAKAMKMFEAQLELVRLGGDIPGGGGNGSVNRLGDPITSLGASPSGDGSSRQGKRLGGPITSLGGSPFGDGSSR
jgi:hypothetical protein